MKVLEVKTLQLDAVEVIRSACFCNDRDYFTEHHRQSDFKDDVWLYEKI